MKICGIICEYNPLHNGHVYLIGKARELSGCDAVICMMSGNFTQRGEPAVLDKYARAGHAILAGADAVIELPTVFALSPAELFAHGAVRLLNAIPGFDTLAFGCEEPDRERFLAAAKTTSEESRGFRRALRLRLKAGISLTRARTEALVETGAGDTAALLQSPNNILGVEYQKALFSCGSLAQILPVKRTGANYSDEELYKNFSSATAIRAAVAEGKERAVRKNVPEFVADDLFSSATDGTVFKKLAVYAALTQSAEQLRRVLDCSEGLENRIKALAKDNPDYDILINKATTKRYISSRIRRILAAATLGISSELVRKALRAPLEGKERAVKNDRADDVLSALGRAAFPAIARKGDLSALSGTAKEVYENDLLAADIYGLVSGKPANRTQTLFIR